MAMISRVPFQLIGRYAERNKWENVNGLRDSRTTGQQIVEDEVALRRISTRASSTSPSSGHRYTPVDLENLSFEKGGYTGWGACGLRYRHLRGPVQGARGPWRRLVSRGRLGVGPPRSRTGTPSVEYGHGEWGVRPREGGEKLWEISKKMVGVE
ncbi:hypothetical protein F5X96DRAFT_675175 [Biscogniauxia mediterranea]|nr:hypothetical protein F5X96DRAFT_675175 [Biscogniauxia mediterranea]